jgi:hypothetical protein
MGFCPIPVSLVVLNFQSLVDDSTFIGDRVYFF